MNLSYPETTQDIKLPIKYVFYNDEKTWGSEGTIEYPVLLQNSTNSTFTYGIYCDISETGAYSYWPTGNWTVELYAYNKLLGKATYKIVE
jgi:hypothetical protein